MSSPSTKMSSSSTDMSPNTTNTSPSPSTNTSSPPSLNHSGATLAAANLSKLGDLIESELKTWMIYLQSIAKTTSYETITSAGNSSETRIQALIHILETLPSRHKKLISAYKAEEAGDEVELSNQCYALLEGLKGSSTESSIEGDDEGKKTLLGGGKKDLDLDGYYDSKLFKAKRFHQEVISQDNEMKEAEEGRLHELKELMVMFEELMILKEDGNLELSQVTLLVQAMDDCGLSASSAVREEEGFVKEERHSMSP